MSLAITFDTPAYAKKLIAVGVPILYSKKLDLRKKEKEVGFRFGMQERFLHPNPTPFFVKIRKLIPYKYNCKFLQQSF